MILQEELEQTLVSSRAARKENAVLRRRTRETRLSMEWQRVRARKQLNQLEQLLEQLSVTLAELGFVGDVLPWTPVRDALDDVLIPID